MKSPPWCCATITCRRWRCRCRSGAAWRISASCSGSCRRWKRAARSIARSNACPTTWQLAERRRRSQPFTRPELSVLLAYAKLTLYDELLESAVPDDPYLSREIGRYFPKEIAAQFPDALEHHRLRREIIATQLANSMINRGGPSLIVRIADQTGAAPAAIASAFAAVRDSYGMTALNGAIDDLDNRISGQAAARSLCGGAGPAARPRHLVLAQCRSGEGPRRRGRALSRRHRRGRSGPR